MNELSTRIAVDQANPPMYATAALIYVMVLSHISCGMLSSIVLATKRSWQIYQVPFIQPLPAAVWSMHGIIRWAYLPWAIVLLVAILKLRRPPLSFTVLYVSTLIATILAIACVVAASVPLPFMPFKV